MILQDRATAEQLLSWDLWSEQKALVAQQTNTWKQFPSPEVPSNAAVRLTYI